MTGQAISPGKAIGLLRRRMPGPRRQRLHQRFPGRPPAARRQKRADRRDLFGRSFGLSPNCHPKVTTA